MVKRAAARDNLWVVVSSLGVTTVECASGVIAGVVPVDSLRPMLPRRDGLVLRWVPDVFDFSSRLKRAGRSRSEEKRMLGPEFDYVDDSK